MKSNWENACDKVIESEGGYALTNTKSDHGGQTYAGIARVANPDWEGWDIIDKGGLPPKDMVRSFYKMRYWERVRGDDLPAGIDYAVYDFAVNSGAGHSVRFLQQSVGVVDDGAIGRGTLAAVEKLDPTEVLEQFSLAKEHFYKSCVDHDPTQAKFFNGWMNRIHHVQVAASAMLA